MLTFLATWNPLRASWSRRADLLFELSQGRPALQVWGVRTQVIQVGDCVYFIRLGKEPRGIFASATAIEPAYKAAHWDPRKRRAGSQSWFASVRFDAMLDVDSERLLDLATLKEQCSATMAWAAQGSGVLVPEPVAIHLQRLWEQHLRQVRK